MPQPAPARSRILDAAERRLLSSGPAGLVLEAVAKQAGVSKGGLLYHFPNKEALVDGLTDRMLAEFDHTQEHLHGVDPSQSGAWARAYLGSTLDHNGAPARESGQLMAGILAGIGGQPERLATVRERFREWQERLAHDDVDAVRATIVRLASDGLWLSALLGLPQLEETLSRQVVNALDAMTRD